MLQAIRSRAQGFFAWVLVIVIGGSFAFWGIGNYLHPSPNTQVAAKVGKEEILVRDVERQYSRILGALRNQNQDIGNISEQLIREQALATLINSEVLVQDAHKRGFLISDNQIKNYVVSDIPDFQVDGKFSIAKYKELLSLMRYDETDFRNDIHNAMLINQLEQGLKASEFILPNEVNDIVKVLEQKRGIAYTIIPYKNFLKDVKISDTEIENYYNTNEQEFIIPEKVQLEYVKLSGENIAKDLKPTEQEIKDFYEARKDIYISPEIVKVSHILIEVPKNADSEKINQSRQQLLDIKDRLNKGEDFATLAQTYSDDKTTAKEGGALGWFGRGEMVKPFEEAAFAIKDKNALSDIVQTEFGFHLIKLLDKEDKKQLPLDEVKDDVINSIKNLAVDNYLAENGDRLATLAFEHPHNLDTLAKDLNLKVETTEYFSRQSADGVISGNPKVLNAAFSDRVLSENLNSDVIEIDQENYVVVRLKDHKLEELKALEVVKNDITEKLTTEKAAQLAIADANKFIDELKTNDKLIASDYAKSKNLAWNEVTINRTDNSLPVAIVNLAFELPRIKSDDNARQYKALQLGSNDAAIVTLLSVHDGKVETILPAKQENYKNGYLSALSEQQYQMYTADAYKLTKVERK